MMSTSFESYADLAMADLKFAGLRPVIEKEILHYEIMNAMIEEGLLKDLVFQGGTSLRLLHGAVRFSEDLVFSGGPSFTAEKAGDIAGAIRHHVSSRYDLPVEVVPPKVKPISGSDPVMVSSWSIRVQTSPSRRNVPAQKIKIDIDSSCSHSADPASLMLNYSFLPASYGDLILRAQSLPEIMANKLAAFPVSVCTRNRPRYRDIWDLRWLERRGVRPDIPMVSAKVAEHGLEGFDGQLESAIERVQEITLSDSFASEMNRFLQADVRSRSLAQPDWLESAAGTVRTLLEEVRDGLREEPRGSDYGY